MDSLINFISENLWLLIVGFIFLSSFSKSKKKKGPPVEEQKPMEEKYFEDEYEDDSWEETRKKELDALPIPQVLKDLLQEEKDDKPFRKKEEKQMPPSTPLPQPMATQVDSPTGGHYDSPWSGQGKEQPHGEVFPTNTIPPPYSGEGKVYSKIPVMPSNVPAVDVSSPYMRKETKKELSRVKERFEEKMQKDAYALKSLGKVSGFSSKKMAEAVVLAEIIGKPKALQKRV